MKVHWWTYNHCMFVSYLTSVAFGYGWISDTKFLKFSDKDWIWILKNLSDMDQESKNQCPLTSACYWPSSHCIPVQKLVAVSRELSHNRSLLMLDSDKGECCHHSSS